MAATKPQYEADIEEMRQAIASGERQVTIGGTTVTYNTADSLRAARADMIREMNRLYPPEQKRSRVITLVHAGRGFE